MKFFSMIKEFKFIFIIFILTISSLFTFLIYNKNKQIEENLKIIQNTYDTKYNITYNNFKRISENTFFGIINKPKIFNNMKIISTESRDNLYNIFISDYNRLLSYKFNQVHFHTKDNKSFLRMHRIDKFGDDLKKIRTSVVRANKELKPIEGFEMGRYLHGFRFTYPLFDKNLFHLGSVEVSVSSEAFEENYENNYSADLHFLLRKDIAKEKMYKEPYNNLIKSFENEDYLFNENGKDEIYHFAHNSFFTKDEKALIKKKMKKSESFIISKDETEDYITIYFKPIKNINNEQNAAYIVIYTHSEYLKLLNENYNIMKLVIVLIVFLFLFLMQNKYNQMLKVKQQKDIFNQQSKLASIGELINNIAHQWRQPLSVISTSASGIKIQNEFGILDNSTLNDSMDTIVSQSEKLSKTIEDFRNLNTINRKREPFNLRKTINSSVHIFDEELNRNNIKVLQNIHNYEIISYPEEFKQVIVILIKNAINIINKDGFIFINTKIEKETITIEVQDSGGGIPKNKISKIFEPYFTTKHKSQGTGMALYTAQTLIANTFKGLIKASNKNFNYQFKTYKGALFTITLFKDKL